MTPFTPGAATAGGILIGGAAALLLISNGRIAGISGILGGALAKTQGDTLWRVLFLLALPLGALGVGVARGGLEIQLSASPLMLVLAGLLVGFGTRLGNGCTSGHGVCGDDGACSCLVGFEGVNCSECAGAVEGARTCEPAELLFGEGPTQRCRCAPGWFGACCDRVACIGGHQD